MKLKHSFVSHGLGNIEEMAKEVRGVVLKFDRSKSGLDLGLEAPLVEFIRLCDVRIGTGSRSDGVCSGLAYLAPPA